MASIFHFRRSESPLVLLDAIDETPPVWVPLREEFFDRRADQRREIRRVLDDLARVLTAGSSRRIGNSGSSPNATVPTSLALVKR